MEMINRELSEILGNQLKTGGKVLVLHGARRFAAICDVSLAEWTICS